MEITVSETGKDTVMALAGRLDALAADGFAKRCDSVLYNKPRALLLDLGALEYASSAGLRAILSLVRKAEGQGLPLAFCSLGPLVTEIFEVAGFFDILKAYPGRGEALKALGGPKA